MESREDYETEQTNINDLPDEVLLLVFRRLSFFDRVFVLALVCDRWKCLLATDGRTLDQLDHVFMQYSDQNIGNDVELNTVSRQFWDVDPCRRIFQIAPHTVWERVVAEAVRNPPLERVHDLALAMAESPWLRDRLRTLVIASQNWRDRVFPHPVTTAPAPGPSGFSVASLVHLTTLAFSEIRLNGDDQCSLTRLGETCPHVRNVTYTGCSISVHFELRYLHCGFGRLQRFRLDHHGAGERFLDELLAEHLDAGLDTVVFYPELNATGDRLIDVLADRLRGRSVRLLIMHNPYFTDARLRRFMAADPMANHSYVNVGCELDAFRTAGMRFALELNSRDDASQDPHFFNCLATPRERCTAHGKPE